MEIVWNLEKVTRAVQKTLRRMIIAVLEQTLPSIVFIGKDKTKWGNAKIRQMAKYFDKITWCYLPSQESHYTLRNVEQSITYEILDNIFQHTNQYILIIQPNFSR
jgi:ribosomal protein S24E